MVELDIELDPDPPGNMNHDDNVDAADIDLLFANLRAPDATYDLDGDADVRDVDQLVTNLMGKRYGDTDLDQDVDINDFNAPVTSFDPTGQDPSDGWAAGNIDGDDDVDIPDLIRLILNFAPLGYTPNDAAVHAPTSVDAIPRNVVLVTVAQSNRDTDVEAAAGDPSLVGPAQANAGAVPGERRSLPENTSVDEHHALDDYFRTEKRRRYRASSWEKSGL